MTSDGLHNVGEEWFAKAALRADLLTRPANIDILLYRDSADTLTDENDVGDIDTEPNTGDYQRESVSLDSGSLSLSQNAQGNVEVSFEVLIDVRNTTGTVDSWGAVVSFQSDIVNAESSANPHLLTTASLGEGRVSLAANDRIRVNGGIEQQ